MRLATWNLENLHAQDGQSTYTGPDLSVKRVARDYERIRCYVPIFDPDILAVREVDGEASLSRVVDTDVYDVHVDDRPKGALNGQQNTGFALQRGLTVVRQLDFEALDIRGDGRQRDGARIDLTHNDQTVQPLSVHLKSAHFENATTSSACETLLAQVPVLEGWIDEAAQGPRPFIVLGHFNRRFTQPNDHVWDDLGDGEPANADLTALTPESPSAAGTTRSRSSSITSSSTAASCPRSIAPLSATSPTVRPTKPSGIRSRTTVPCSSSCGVGNEGAADQDAVDDDLALDRLEVQTGLKTNRGMITHQALELFLNTHESSTTRGS
jgi:hypothetical protein